MGYFLGVSESPNSPSFPRTNNVGILGVVSTCALRRKLTSDQGYQKLGISDLISDEIDTSYWATTMTGWDARASPLMSSFDNLRSPAHVLVHSMNVTTHQSQHTMPSRVHLMYLSCCNNIPCTATPNYQSVKHIESLSNVLETFTYGLVFFLLGGRCTAEFEPSSLLFRE